MPSERLSLDLEWKTLFDKEGEKGKGWPEKERGRYDKGDENLFGSADCVGDDSRGRPGNPFYLSAGNEYLGVGVGDNLSVSAQHIVGLHQ